MISKSVLPATTRCRESPLDFRVSNWVEGELHLPFHEFALEFPRPIAECAAEVVVGSEHPHLKMMNAHIHVVSEVSDRD